MLLSEPVGKWVQRKMQWVLEDLQQCLPAVEWVDIKVAMQSG